MRTTIIGLTGLALLAGGCTTTATGGRAAPVEVSRYHLGSPIERGTVAVIPAGDAAMAFRPDTAVQITAVQAELARLGYASAPADSATYTAAVAFVRAPRGVLEDRPPVSIGIGGGTGGGGVGVGGGVSLPIGRARSREVLLSELSVQIRRRADNSVVWDGRAQTETVEARGPASPAAGADRLARALFRDFPGESGITNTVR